MPKKPMIFKIKPLFVDAVHARNPQLGRPKLLRNQLTNAGFVLASANSDLKSGKFIEYIGEEVGEQVEIEANFEWMEASVDVTTKVTVVDYGNNVTVMPSNYTSDAEVKLRNMPEKIDCIEVTVDNGRLGIELNGECIFYTSSIADGVVKIQR